MEVDPVSIDWETLIGSSIAFLKFLFGFYGLPVSSSAQMPSLATNPITVVYRVADSSQQQRAADVLRKRLAALHLEASVTQDEHTLVKVETRVPGEIDVLLGKLKRVGSLEVWYGSERLLGADDYAGADLLEPERVQIRLTEEAGRHWADVTKRLVGQAVTVRLDDVELASPVVQEPIESGELVLSGPGIDAQMLLFFINSGALPGPLLQLELKRNPPPDRDL
jgi:SecDF, P1 head subdomain